MQSLARPASNSVPRRFSDEALGLAPFLILCVILAWLAVARTGSPAQGGIGATPPATELPRAVVAEGVRFFVVAVGHERAMEIRELLEAETELRGFLGEAPRTADVIETSGAEEAAKIAEAIRSDVLEISVAVLVAR